MATSSILDDRTRALLDRERRLLERLAAVLEAAGLADDARRAAEAAAALSETFLVVVVGEFNAGKSSLINALFGEKLMAEGPIPTTAKITLVRYGEAAFERQLSAYIAEQRVPSELLRYLTLVDTPGTNSIIEEHERLTKDYVPRADLVLFVTSYDRPLAASERQFLEYVRGAWGKHFACVVNKADLARSEEDLAQVVEHVKSGIRDALGFEPEVFALSAMLAYEARTHPSEPVRASLRTQSRFAPFETYVREALAGPDRVVLKLRAPLDAATARLGALEAPLGRRRKAQGEETERLRALRTRLDASATDFADAALRPLAEIDHLIDETRARGVTFLDAAFRPTGIGLLRDRDRFKDEFQRQVTRDLDKQIEARVADGVDALQRRSMDMWQATVADLRAGSEAVTGLERANALAALEREAEKQLALHDVREEARSLLENARGSSDFAQYAGYGAIGVGVLSGVVMITTTMDALGGFGVATAGVLGIASLTVLPMHRRRAKAAFETRMESLRRDLHAALAAEFARQAGELATRASASITPFEHAAEVERAAIASAEAEVAALRTEISELRVEVESVGAAARAEGRVDPREGERRVRESL
jgi:GTP-binding protein EngB required for normal cell division